MKETLDDKFNSSEHNESFKIRNEIKLIESKNWYGIVLICVVIALTIISLLILKTVTEIDLTILLINVLLILTNIVLLFLAQKDKLLAYSGGLMTFALTFVLNGMLLERFFLNNIYIGFVTSGIFMVFIYEEIKLKKLKSKL